MVVRAVAVGWGLGVILACGGAGEPVAPDPIAAPDPAEPVVAEPVVPPSEPTGARLFVVDPSAGCVWRVVGVDGGSRDLARTDVCPEQIWFAPDGARVVALGGGWAWYGPLDALGAVEAPHAEAVFPVDGKPMIAHILYEESDTSLVIQRLEGAAFGPPTQEGLSEMDLMMGNPLGSHDDADAGWTSLHHRDTPAKSAYLEPASDAAKAAVNATSEESSVGQIPVGSSFLTYRIEFGDSPHPMPPAVWCAASDCADTTALAGALPGQLTLEPRGDLVLVTEEYSGAEPAVYRAGSATPVWTGPAGARAMWAPTGL